MNENSNKIKKIPILSYLCCLLAVSVLFTGVTFSRYSSSTSGDVASSLVPYIASYEIDNISATSFPNTNYWLAEDRAVGTPRTVRYTMRNFEAGENGVQRINLLDLQGSIRLYVPAELAQNLALQVEQVQEDGTGTAVTPQYVLAGLFNIEDGGTWNTAAEENYSDLAGADDETMTVTGSLEDGGSLFAQAAGGAQGNSLSVSAFSQTVQYSVGFQRGVPTGSGSAGGADTLLTDLQPQLFLDLEKEELYYAIDITAPEEMLFEGGAAQEKTFVLYITLTTAINVEGSDFNISWENETGYLTEPSAGADVLTFNRAVVLGYHFDVEAQTYALNETSPRGTLTTVRVTKSYGRNDAGTQYTGEAALSFSHVAPISEGAVNYVHPIQNFYTDTNGTPGSAPADIEEAQSLYGICTNLLGEEGEYYISFKGVPDNPRYASYGDGTALYAMSVSLSKNYPTRLTAIFVQASQSPASGTDEEVSV